MNGMVMADKREGRKSLRETSWYPYAMVGCIVVAFYVLLTHLSQTWALIGSFLSFFTPVFYGCILAYIVNPLGKFFERKLFKGLKKDSTRWICSSALAFVLIAGFVILAVSIIVPQLIDSIATFATNLDDYVASLAFASNTHSGLGGIIDLEALETSGRNALQNLVSFANENADAILDIGLSAGKSIVNWGIALILSVYLLLEKNKLKAGVLRLMHAVFAPAHYDAVIEFLRRSDAICNRYIVFNLIDSLIIGSICAIAMTIAGMPYVGLVAFAVGVTNLIPTFGPVIGGVIGAFILLLTSPLQAAGFIVIVVVLQFFDGYILKPRLFGSSLGVGGLWILIAVIVGGSMFGVAGMLAAIPAMAIIDFSYHDYFLPWLESRRAAEDAEDLELAKASDDEPLAPRDNA